MADKRCENGHVIDETWDLCPYCPAAPKTDIPIVRPTRSREVDESSRSYRHPDPESSYGRSLVPDLGEQSRPAIERTVAVVASTPAELAKPRFVVAWLVGLNGKVRGESFPIRIGRNVLGRDRKSDVHVPDEQASAHHADLVYRPEEKRFILMDHNSTNGTYVNEAEIEPRRDLARRDIIRIGTHKFLFQPLCDDEFSWDDQGQRS